MSGEQRKNIIVDWEKIHQKLKSNERSLLKNTEAFGDEIKFILKKRADRLSKELKPKDDFQDKIEVLAFQIEAEKYGIEVLFIHKVYLLKDLTPLPGVSPHIIGMINVRGQIVPVLDFRKIFELSATDNTSNQKVIVISVNDATFGLLADEVLGLEAVLVNEIQRDLPTLNGPKVEYINGVTFHQMVILDPLKIAAHKSIVVNDEL